MIHQYKLNDLNIVLDVGSGSVHVVDEVAYDIISMFENETKDEITKKILEKYSDNPEINKKEISDCISDIQNLKDSGKLFLNEDYTLEAVNFKASNNEIKALCMHISHACNLCCEYCFAGQGKYKGEEALMSFEVGKQAFDFLIKNSGKRRNLEVDFFGGEPLMNFDTVKKLVEYAREIEKEHGKNFRFTLTTNGVLLDDDVIDFANKEMDNVVLSLDGRKEIHDKYRVDYKGKGSYDLVVPKFQEFIKKRDSKGYYMRGTYTKNNLDFTNDVFHMADLGFKELSMEPVVSDENDASALNMNDLPVLFEQYEILLKEMIKRKKEGNGFTFYHYMLDLSHGPCIYKRVSGCGSGTEYFAVTPSGDLYPCHQFVGDKKYLMGNVWDGVTEKEKQDEFRKCTVYSKKECHDCWARLYCAGGCAANAYHSTGDIMGLYSFGCELFKKRIECAIALYISENME